MTNQSYDAKDDHTRKAYLGLADAYQHFNTALFDGSLPSCLITVRMHKKALGYFSPKRFASGEHAVDEIALNSTTFAERTPKQTLSTLVHEMVHLWQQHFGEAPKRAYHNKEWGQKMKTVGLYPSSTAEVGGKETGAKVSHYIIKHNRFDRACDEFLANGELSLYADNQTEASRASAKKKAESKTKYTCEMCGCNAWAKPGTHLICGLCEEPLLSEDGEELASVMRKAKEAA